MSSEPVDSTGALDVPVGAVIWEPTAAAIADTNILRFISRLNQSLSVHVEDYADLHKFSISDPDAFWSEIWDFVEITGLKGEGPYVTTSKNLRDTLWFPNSRLNIAENLLEGPPDEVAVIAYSESGKRCELTRKGLRELVYSCAGALRAEGVCAGDAVVGFLVNGIEAVVSAIATLSIGAVWSVCSPEYSADAVIQRFSVVRPKVLFAALSSEYRGVRHDLKSAVLAIVDGLPTLARVVRVVQEDDGGSMPLGFSSPVQAEWDTWLESATPIATPLERFPFDHPCYVVFTSGTTGPPKAMVHRAGGVLLKHAVDYVLQFDAKPGDRVLRYTNTGWMIWNSLVSALGFGCSIVLYDGNPFTPSAQALPDIIDRESVTYFGAAPAVFNGWMAAGLEPHQTHDFLSLRCISAGGASLSPEAYRYIYSRVNPDVHLSSPSGGTEILSFFVGGNPVAALRVGEVQAPALGLDVQVFDREGRRVLGDTGELVCLSPCPSMPLKFLGAHGDDQYGEYFRMFPGIWQHGDLAVETEHGGFRILGRSDSTLKLNGVRIGISEISSVVLSIDGIVEAVPVVRTQDGADSLVLFVELAHSALLDEALVDLVCTRLRSHGSPRHVPALVKAVPEFPRNANGKVVYSAVADAANGSPVRRLSEVVNSTALRHFE